MSELVVRLLRAAAAIIVIAALFTYFGVYNTDRLPTYKAFVFWLATMITGAGAGLFVVPKFMEGSAATWPRAVQIFASASIISVPVWFVVMLFSVGPDGPPPPSDWPAIFLSVLVVSLVVTAVAFFGFVFRDRAPEDASRCDTDTSAFMARLEPKFRGAALFGVSSEDHYLRVHTDRGAPLILMRLADAEKELANAGLRVHRSWWVAHGGVADAERANGRLTLVLKSGARVPVSRANIKSVKDAGLA
ncbi:MAG: LytTR family DNA-binding domain-containing protein [Pseudomonadota bacterium]